MVHSRPNYSGTLEGMFSLIVLWYQGAGLLRPMLAVSHSLIFPDDDEMEVPDSLTSKAAAAGAKGAAAVAAGKKMWDSMPGAPKTGKTKRFKDGQGKFQNCSHIKVRTGRETRAWQHEHDGCAAWYEGCNVEEEKREGLAGRRDAWNLSCVFTCPLTHARSPTNARAAHTHSMAHAHHSTI